MPPHVTTARAQYRQVADLIRAGIENGEYPPGSLMPPEPVLAARYGTTRAVVSKASHILRGEGLIHVIRGRAGRGAGTWVRPIPVIRREAVTRYRQEVREYAGSRGAFDAEIRSQGMTPRVDLQIARETPPLPLHVENILGPWPVLVRRRMMYADDIPVQLAPSYIPLDIADGTALAEKDSGPGGIVSRFADLGYRQTRITESIRLRRATDPERAFLRLEEDAPVTEILHTGWAGERPVEVTVHSLPGYLWLLDYEWSLSHPQ